MAHSKIQKRGHDSEAIDSRFGEHSAYRATGVWFTYNSSTYECASCMDAISGAESIPQSPHKSRVRLGQHRAHSRLATSVGASLTGKVFMVPNYCHRKAVHPPLHSSERAHPDMPKALTLHTTDSPRYHPYSSGLRRAWQRRVSRSWKAPQLRADVLIETGP